MLIHITYSYYQDFHVKQVVVAEKIKGSHLLVSWKIQQTKMLVTGQTGNALPIRTNIIKVGFKSWLLTCSSNITFINFEPTFIYWFWLVERDKFS